MTSKAKRWLLLAEAELVCGLLMLGAVTRHVCGGRIRWNVIAMEAGFSVLLVPLIWILIRKKLWWLAAIVVVVVLSNLLREIFVPAMAPGLLDLTAMAAFVLILTLPITWVHVKNEEESHEGQ